MEQRSQDVDQKVQYDANLDTFAEHLAQHFDQRQTTQYCYEIIKF